MTSPPSQPSAPFPVQPRPRNWLERNWKWAVPVVVFAGVLVLTLFIGGIFWGVMSIIRSSYPYQLAVKRATESPAVAAKLGIPLQKATSSW
jgi:hypothetical protein